MVHILRLSWRLGLRAFVPVVVGVSMLVATPALAETPRAELPEGGRSLWSDTYLNRLQRTGGQADLLTTSVVDVTGQPFDKALRLETSRRSGDARAAGVEIPLTGAISNGDVVHIRMRVRAARTLDETGQGRMAFHIRQLPHRQPAASLAGWRNFGEQWTLIDLPVPGSRISAPAGGSSLTIYVGGTQPQTVEIGGIEVVNFGPGYDTRLLPFERVTYDGREEDAQWRKDALERIEELRKGNLTVRVTDADGTPVEGAGVQVEMTRHAYGFGTAVNARWFLNQADTPDGRRFHSELKRLFNKVAPTNELKWIFLEDQNTAGAAERFVNWAEEHDMKVHAHTLVWPSRLHIPDRAKRLLDTENADEMQEVILTHIENIVGRFRGRVASWDVINEPVDHHTVTDLVGRERMVEWWHAAHRADPDALLMLNENNLLAGAKVDRIVEMARYLQAQGAPIHLIGAQGHVGPTLSMHTIRRSLDRLAEVGLPIEITEYDTVTPDAELQGDFTRDVMITVFAHPATRGFTMWGFWDGMHWLNDAPIYYRDWEKKPAGKAFEDLVFNQWWTNETLTTNSDGSAAVRGFLGDYTLTVTTSDGRTRTVDARLEADGTSVEVRLDS